MTATTANPKSTIPHPQSTYDGLGRRTKTFINTSAPLDQTYDEFLHFYYNSGWQIVETRRADSENGPPDSENPEVQYVWSRRYVDAPVLRDENLSDGSGGGFPFAHYGGAAFGSTS